MVTPIAPTPATPTGPDLPGAGSHRGRPSPSALAGRGHRLRKPTLPERLTPPVRLGLFYFRGQATVSRFPWRATELPLFISSLNVRAVRRAGSF